MNVILLKNKVWLLPQTRIRLKPETKELHKELGKNPRLYFVQHVHQNYHIHIHLRRQNQGKPLSKFFRYQTKIQLTIN